MSAEREERPLLLAYRSLGLGDFLTAVPALRALARAYPEHRRVLCAPAALAPLLQLTASLDELAETRALAVPESRWHGAQVAVNLHGRGPQSHMALLAAAPARLIAFDNAAAGHRGPRWRADEHEVARWCRLLDEAGIPTEPGDLRLGVPPWDPPQGAAGATVIHPGASSVARRWPAERFAAVAREQREAGSVVAITGSFAERALGERVAELAGLDEASVWAGKTSLAELAAIAANAKRVICGDTGMAHLATAFGTPSVVIFGPTPPDLWGPPGDRPEHIVLWAGRTGDPHANETDPGLLQVTVDDALRALDRLEATTSRPLSTAY